MIASVPATGPARVKYTAAGGGRRIVVFQEMHVHEQRLLSEGKESCSCTTAISALLVSW